MDLHGCGTALVTPFRDDGSVDEAALTAHVHWQIANGISLLVPAGTTGEASTLSEEEWLRVVHLTVQAADGRVPVFAGSTHNNTAQAVANARKLAGIAGLSGILSANPYYNRPGQEGQFQHFRAIAETTDLPLLLYNIPGRTGANLLPESSGSLVQITELLTQVPRTFCVFAGDDALALPTIAVGGVGLISVASNAIPQQMTDLISAAAADNWMAARRMNSHLFALLQANFLEPSPAPIKAVMALMGRANEQLRLPMVPVTPPTRLKLAQILSGLGLLPARDSAEALLQVS